MSQLYDRMFIKIPKLRRLVTRIIYGDRDINIELIGADLIINTLLENGYYRSYIASRSRSLIRDEISVMLNINSILYGSVRFVDVGANIGIFSCVAARLKNLNSELNVTAFEVDPITFKRLSRNASMNGFEAINIGVSDTDHEREFVRGAVSHVTSVSSAINPYAIKGEIFRSKLVRLDSIVFPEEKLVVKIDVEGHELEVLRGMKCYLEANRVRAVYFDGFEKSKDVMDMLKYYEFRFLNGRTLKISTGEDFSLLAVKI